MQLGGAMERCLLAALAVHCGETVSAESLVDALWGDDPRPGHPHPRLRHAVSDSKARFR
jgi:hypothetical protein